MIRGRDRSMEYTLPEYHLGIRLRPDFGRMVKKEPCIRFTWRRGGTYETSESRLVGGKIVRIVCRTEWCCNPAQPSVCRILLHLRGTILIS